jgi:hypothetical protein
MILLVALHKDSPLLKLSLKLVFPPTPNLPEYTFPGFPSSFTYRQESQSLAEPAVFAVVSLH